jgi:hypothetical protein
MGLEGMYHRFVFVFVSKILRMERPQCSYESQASQKKDGLRITILGSYSPLNIWRQGIAQLEGRLLVGHSISNY